MDLSTHPFLALSGEWWFAIAAVLEIALCLFAIFHILRTRKTPMAMLSWILGILLFPFVGVGIYFLLGERRVRRRARKKRKRVEPIAQAIATASRKEMREEREVSPPEVASLPLSEEGLLQLAGICTQLGSFPLTTGNKVQVFTSALEVYENLLQAIDGAEHHVHLEYYIFRPDQTGRLFRDHLVEKAREGIEVRLLLDGIGSFTTRFGFMRPLLEAGARVEVFLPAIPLRRPWHINCRNHRKIAVVDGKTAYTGSQNIGDEHRGILHPRGPWKETHLRVDGPAAQQLQDVFIEDWFFACREDLTSSEYLNLQPPQGDSLIQIVPSGPDQEESILTHIFFSALSLARESIRIRTPYFVPHPGLILALQNAAYRGVKVEIIIPSKTDNQLVLWAGRSYYQELLRSGVHIYEYEKGMLHSKTVNIDDRWSLIGSANMDVRSFLLNFEVTANIFDEKAAGVLEKEFRVDLAQCREVPLHGSTPGPILPSLLEGAARLFSPLL